MSNWWRRFSAMSNGERHDSKPAVSLEEQVALGARLAAEASDGRRRALQGEECVVEEIAALLFREDPIGIAFGRDDEYIAEAETIALLLRRAKDFEDVRSRVHETFVQWFDADIAGEPARYDSIAQAVLAIWQRHHPP